MNSIKFVFLITLFSISILANSQKIDAKKFFADEEPLQVTLITDLNSLLNRKLKNDKQKAYINFMQADSTIKEEISLNLRGHSRRELCYMPPLHLEFTKKTTPYLAPLKKLKLVSSCRDNLMNEQWLLKEYLIYKIYNMLTPKSFRARLLKINYEDINAKKKPFTKYAFLVENIDAMAKRNECKELDSVKVATEATNRDQMTLVALFEYFIGNTDWSVLANHNIKLIQPKSSKFAYPFAVPYDFDYSGLVNTDYSIPDEKLGIEKVTQRLYRGYPRTMPEIETALKIFTDKKDSIYNLIKKFEPISLSTEREMIDYLDIFYKTISSKTLLKDIFISNSRRD